MKLLLLLNMIQSVRKNVTIPAWLCEIAKQKNINFSQTLQKALMEELNIS